MSSRQDLPCGLLYKSVSPVKYPSIKFPNTLLS